ncbi:MAG: hypothetical protein HC923_12295 [Myxococcales bacterium]|nr:hypothetical protein [Myxococcales bacterium]
MRALGWFVAGLALSWTSELRAEGDWLEEAVLSADSRQPHRLTEQLEAALASIAAAVRGLPANERIRAKAVLQLAHGGVLRRYDARATTLEDVMTTGDFNCVSSALLYNLAAEHVGLETRVELLPHPRAQPQTSVQLRTSEHRSMYSYVRLSIDRCTATYV